MDDFFERYFKSMEDASKAEKGSIVTAQFNWLAPGLLTAKKKYQIEDVISFYVGDKMDSLYFLVTDDEGRKVKIPFSAFTEFSLIEF